MKAYIYCTKSNPLLLVNEHNFFVTEYRATKGNTLKELNGTICLSCEINGAYWIMNSCYMGTGFGFDPVGISQEEAHERSGYMSLEELKKYANDKSLYALQLENVKKIEPLGIGWFYKDEECTKPLTKAPQSWCYAYSKELVYHDWGDTKRVVNLAPETNKVLILSIHPQYVCMIGNGEKDLEIRKTKPSCVKTL